MILIILYDISNKFSKIYDKLNYYLDEKLLITPISFIENNNNIKKKDMFSILLYTALINIIILSFVILYIFIFRIFPHFNETTKSIKYICDDCKKKNI